MSSSGVVIEPPSKAHNNQNKSQIKNNNNTSSKRKNKHDRNGRKRSKSFSGCGLVMSMKPVPPTKFLLGGNINDPLNLNSLRDEEINRAMNAATPKSSPIPTPPRRKAEIEVIIPQNIHDPLNLIDCATDDEYEQPLSSPVKKGRKKRLKKRRTMSSSAGVCASLESSHTEAKTPETSTDSAKIPDVEVAKDLSLELTSPQKKEINKGGKRKSDEHGPPAKKPKNPMDKIVSPVVPQPGAWLKRMTEKQPPRFNKAENEKTPQFKEKHKQFQYGNYNRYYGYRNPNKEVDPRLKLFSQHRYLFEGKDILDVGCNIGHITLSVAREFGAKSVTGIDIDPKLVAIARKNVKHYVKNSESPQNRDDDCDTEVQKSSEFFPISMPILYGSIDIPGFSDTHKGKSFPNNVVFKQCNYILEDDSLLALEQPQFDVILCLSITKWIHLNWGDAGVKQAFRRMYAQLRPGGRLILEPQNWAGYKSKRKLTETTFKNYNSIEFFPDKFTEYLLSSVVGFAKSEILAFPSHQSKGFRRPIQIYTKSTMFPSERIETTPSNITPCSQVYSLKTDKYESQSQIPIGKFEHIYCTNILERYCGYSAEENEEINNLIADDFSRAVKEQDQNVKAKKEKEKEEEDEVKSGNKTEPDNVSVDKT